MKKVMAALTLIMFASVNAFADGFVCESDASDLRIKVYNKVSPSEGTRVASVMIVTDPRVSGGRKTVAKFSTDRGTLATAHNQSLKFAGNVDLRFSDLSAGEYLVGTRLGEVDTIHLTIDFVYGDNLANGEQTSGRMLIVKRDGDSTLRYATCTRYLKGE